MTTCRSCGAEIEWVETMSGKSMPLDVGEAPSEARHGVFAVVAGKARTYTDADRKLARERRTSHFATCPDASDWRKS
jgi:hypothetical protein